MTNARHMKVTNRWGTPDEIVECARRVMGAIDLDPCSEDRFNRTVRATRYYSLLERGEDGLKLPWFGRVVVNPPGGLVPEFWDKLFDEDVAQAVWIGFSVEQLCILADARVHPLDFSCCILRRRIPFVRHDWTEMTPDEIDEVNRPGHGNYVCGINTFPDAFEREFGPLGKVVHGQHAHELLEP